MHCVQLVCEQWVQRCAFSESGGREDLTLPQWLTLVQHSANRKLRYELASAAGTSSREHARSLQPGSFAMSVRVRSDTAGVTITSSVYADRTSRKLLARHSTPRS